MVAECTAEIITDAIPQLGKKIIYVAGTDGGADDFITVPSLQIVEGAFLVASDGTIGELTFATNVITITNGNSLAWTGLAWGY